ncbi:MAG: hypothetical protein WDO74_33950 [Pseudomonadota bacterium]
MRRSATKSLLSAFLLTLGSLALIPSCADNNSSLFVVGVMELDPTTCVAKPDSSAVLLAGGILDVAFRSSYTAFVLVGNQLTERGSREQLRTETSRVALRGAEVTLTTLDGRTLGNYSTVGTGFVDASAEMSPRTPRCPSTSSRPRSARTPPWSTRAPFWPRSACSATPWATSR